MRTAPITTVAAAIATAGILPAGRTLVAQPRDIGNGFVDHGVAAPVARSRGATATVDGNGRNVVLAYLSDHRSCTSIVVIDATTGETRQVDVPLHQIHPGTLEHEMALESPIGIGIGIALVGGRLYFAAGSHIYSCRAPTL